MRTAVANALWIPPQDRRSPNLQGELPVSAAELYLKNSYCSLASVRRFNPSVELVLVYDGDLLPPFAEQFRSLGVRLVAVPFVRYLVPESYPWKGGYYKLDALEWLAGEYDRFLLLDTDTICVAPLDQLFHETRDRVLLYATGHREQERSRRIINEFGRFADGREHRAYHWGGEAVALDRPVAEAWIKACRGSFGLLSGRWEFFHEDNPDQGDELVLSLAAETRPDLVGLLNPYLQRYWTLKGTANLSTKHNLDPVDIWHLPWEKKSGFLDLYKHLQKNGTWPCEGDLIRMLHLEQGVGTGLIWFLRKLKRRLVGGKQP